MGWLRWGGLTYDGAISFNGVSFGISFVLDEVGCSMLVRFSGSTPSLDHSFDGISIGISLDHTLAISFWYVLLVEPSSCNLHEGTLVFLIQGGFSNRSPRLPRSFASTLAVNPWKVSVIHFVFFSSH